MMAGPWEDYQTAMENPPWLDYVQSPPPAMTPSVQTALSPWQAATYRLGAAVEPNLALATGALATPIAGLHGIATGLGNVLGLSMANPAESVASTQHALTYAPRTEGGKTAMEAISYPFKKLSEGSEKVADAILEATGSPTLAATVKTAIEAAPAVAGMKLKGTNAAIEAGQHSAKTMGEMTANLADLVLAEGPSNMVIKGIKRKLLGEQYVPEVQSTLARSQDILPARAPVPGAAGPTLPASRTTVAEALVNTPAGSPLQAHQAMIAKTPGGPSAEFGQLMAEKITARKAAMADREAVTTPLREQAIADVNKNGGAPTQDLITALSNMKNAPGNKSNAPLQKGVMAVEEQIQNVRDKSGHIEANELYTIRKNLNKTIESAQGDNVQFDKAVTGGIARDIQKHIDQTMIDAGGGKSWRHYMEEYARRSKAIEADELRTEMMYKPLQRTSLASGLQASEYTKHLLPNWLAKPITGTKWAFERVSEHLQPKLEAAAADFYKNPHKLAEALKDVPPSQRYAVVDALLKQAAPYALAGSAATSLGR